MNEQTCKTCKHQKGILKHPWNKQEWARGACNELIAYGCAIEDAIEKNGSIILMESDSGYCEMYEIQLSEDN